MEKFNSERIETLILQFYKILGQLEIEKNIVIPDNQIKIFEKNLMECKSEVEASSYILGSIRRYKIKLEEEEIVELTSEVSAGHVYAVTSQSDTLRKDSTSEENLMVEPDILLINRDISGDENLLEPTHVQGTTFQQHDLPDDETAAFHERPVEEMVAEPSVHQDVMALTNTLTHNEPYLMKEELSTTHHFF